jgi:hypothetical protein
MVAMVIGEKKLRGRIADRFKEYCVIFKDSKNPAQRELILKGENLMD